MSLLRRLSIAALVLGFGHVVFGAIVRITGSGMGCGDHWPRCHGYWFPPFTRMDLIIEVTHRYLAAALSGVIIALLVIAFVRRREPGIGGGGGVLRPAALASLLVVAAALFGAATVKLELTNPYVIVVHLGLAMALLATLIVMIARSGERHTDNASGSASDAASASLHPSPRAARGAAVAAGLTFAAILLGGLTAHIPGANSACEGFPLCGGTLLPDGAAAHVQVTHRLLAFLLLFHLIGYAIAVARRGEPRAVVALARLSAALVVAQLVIAAVLVELQLPAILRSLHQAVGTAIWIATFSLALRARVGAGARTSDAKSAAGLVVARA